VQSYAGDLANDTVWTKKTDEMQGFSSVQFIKNDEIIVAQSSISTAIFYNSIDGNELRRLNGVGKTLFFDNDNKFIFLNYFDCKENMEQAKDKVKNYSSYSSTGDIT